MGIQLLQESLGVSSVTLISPNTRSADRDTTVVLPNPKQKVSGNMQCTGQTAKPGTHWLTE